MARTSANIFEVLGEIKLRKINKKAAEDAIERLIRAELIQPPKVPRESTEKYKYQPVDHQAPFLLFGKQFQLLNCVTKESGTIIFGLFMALAAIGQQIIYYRSLEPKFAYWYDVMNFQVETMSDKVFIFGFAVFPIGCLLITPGLSMFSFLKLFYVVNKNKVEFSKNARTYSNSLIFGWLMSWFLILNWMKRGYLFYSAVSVLEYSEITFSTDLVFEVFKFSGWCAQIVAAVIISGLVLEVQSYMRDQEKDSFVRKDGEFVDETPRVVLLFMMTALIYSLYEIF